jgi:hypothetical protein
MAEHGEARRGDSPQVRPGTAWHGSARPGWEIHRRQGEARIVWVWPGLAGIGDSSQEWLGMARRDKAIHRRHGAAGHGEARQGMARLGTARNSPQAFNNLT